MSYDKHANFAYSTVATAPSPALSGTSLVVAAGDGTKFPAVPFNATIWGASIPTTTTAEIVRVTTISTDTLTITRAQEGSSARTVLVGDQIAASVTAKTLTDIESTVLARARLTGQTAAAAAILVYTVGAADSSFEVNSNILVTASTTHNFTMTCSYTDEGNTSRVYSMAWRILTGGGVTAVTDANGAIPYGGAPVVIRCKAATTITFATTGTFTTVTYNVEALVRQVA